MPFFIDNSTHSFVKEVTRHTKSLLRCQCVCACVHACKCAHANRNLHTLKVEAYFICLCFSEPNAFEELCICATMTTSIQMEFIVRNVLPLNTVRGRAWEKRWVSCTLLLWICAPGLTHYSFLSSPPCSYHSELGFTPGRMTMASPLFLHSK